MSYRLRRMLDYEPFDRDADDDEHALRVFGALFGVALTLKEGPSMPEHMLGRIGKGYWSKPEYLPVREVRPDFKRGHFHKLNFRPSQVVVFAQARRLCLDSPPGKPRRVLLRGVAVALEAVRASSAGVQERGGGEACAGPAAAKRSAPRLRSPLATGPGRLPGTAPAVCLLPGPGARGAGDRGRPHRGDQRLFWDEGNWAPSCKPCHDAKTAREGRC